MNFLSARRLLAFLSLVLLLTLSADCQQVLLKYKFKAGDVSRYKETTHNEVTSEALPNGTQKVLSQMYSTQKVKKVNTDGTAQLVRTLDSANTLLNGQPFDNPQTRTLVGIPIIVTVARTGNDFVDATVKQAIATFRQQVMTQPSFPKTAIAMNRPWHDSASYSQESPTGNISTEIRFSTKLTGVDKISGLNAKVLERTLELSGTIGNGTGTFKGTGKGNVYFSDILAKEILSTITIDQSMEMVTPQGPMSTTMQVTSKKELLR